MAKTLAELLDEVTTAISRLLSHQIVEYEFGGKRFEYQDIWQLEKIRDKYAEAVAREEGGNRPIMLMGDVSRRAI